MQQSGLALGITKLILARLQKMGDDPNRVRPIDFTVDFPDAESRQRFIDGCAPAGFATRQPLPGRNEKNVQLPFGLYLQKEAAANLPTIHAIERVLVHKALQ